jgi:hypothetical protein
MIVANAAQATVNRRDNVAIDQIHHVAEDCLRRGRQGAAFVVIAPRTEVFPIGGVLVEGVFRVAMGVSSPVEEGPACPVRLGSSFSHMNLLLF